MPDKERDAILKAMAANRGCRLVKSRKRTPGTGDYGRYGLQDLKTGQDVFGFGGDGLTAAPEEIEAFLRSGVRTEWRASLREAGGPPPSKKKAAARADPPPAPAPRPAPEPEPEPDAPPEPEPEPELVVREARPRDAPALAGLAGGGEAAMRRRLATARKAGPVLVAEKGEVIGCVVCAAVPQLQDDAPLGLVTLLVVAEEERRRGVGRALIEAAEKAMAATGCRRVAARADIEFAGAPAFFRKLGYERNGYRLEKDLGGGR